MMALEEPTCATTPAPPGAGSTRDDVAPALIDGDPARDAPTFERAAFRPNANVPVATGGPARNRRMLRPGTPLTSAEVAAFIRDRYRGPAVPVGPC